MRRARSCGTEILLKVRLVVRVWSTYNVWAFDSCTHFTSGVGIHSLLGSAVPLIESLKSKTTDDYCADTEKHSIHLQQLLLFRDSRVEGYARNRGAQTARPAWVRKDLRFCDVIESLKSKTN